MQLKIKGEEYQITQAILRASVIDPEQPYIAPNGETQSGLFWCLDVHAEDESINFWHEAICLPDIHRWTDIVGKSAVWDSANNEITGEMNGGWYGGDLICGHLAILESKLHFKERNGCKIRINWHGTASGAPLGCEPSLDEQLAFQIDCWCVFDGIAGLDPELIRRYLDLSDFSQETLRLPDAKSDLFQFKPL